VTVRRTERLMAYRLITPEPELLEMARVDKLFQVSGKNYLPPQQ